MSETADLATAREVLAAYDDLVDYLRARIANLEYVLGVALDLSEELI